MGTIHIAMRKYKRSRDPRISFSWAGSGLHPISLVTCDLTHPMYKVEDIGSCAWESPKLCYAVSIPDVTYSKSFLKLDKLIWDKAYCV